MPQLTKQPGRLLVQGALNIDTLNSVLAESAGLIGAENLEVDLSAVTEVDSSAISLLFEWLRHAHANKSRLEFANLPPNLVSLATLYGVLDLIPQHAH